MDIRKIGIIHLNQIGDLVFSLPLLKALQGERPGGDDPLHRQTLPSRIIK